MGGIGEVKEYKASIIKWKKISKACLYFYGGPLSTEIKMLLSSRYREGTYHMKFL